MKPFICIKNPSTRQKQYDEMADKDKKKKTKKKDDKKEAASAAETAAPTPEAEPTPEKQPTPPKSETPKSPSGSSSRASRGSRRAKRTGSSIFSMFTQKQVAEFKEAFQLMDRDKDGIIGKEDLRFIFDQVGKIVNDKELDDMLVEVEGPINFTALLQMFASRMQGGGADDDDVIIKAFATFDDGRGKIDGERLRHMLLTYNDKFTVKEVNEAFDHMFIDDKGYIDIESLINMLTGKEEDDD